MHRMPHPYAKRHAGAASLSAPYSLSNLFMACYIVAEPTLCSVMCLNSAEATAKQHTTEAAVDKQTGVPNNCKSWVGSAATKHI